MSSQWHQEKRAAAIHCHFAAVSSVVADLFCYPFCLDGPAHHSQPKEQHQNHFRMLGFGVLSSRAQPIQPKRIHSVCKDAAHIPSASEPSLRHRLIGLGGQLPRPSRHVFHTNPGHPQSSKCHSYTTFTPTPVSLSLDSDRLDDFLNIPKKSMKDLRFEHSSPYFSE